MIGGASKFFEMKKPNLRLRLVQFQEHLNDEKISGWRSINTTTNDNHEQQSKSYVMVRIDMVEWNKLWVTCCKIVPLRVFCYLGGYLTDRWWHVPKKNLELRRSIIPCEKGDRLRMNNNAERKISEWFDSSNVSDFDWTELKGILKEIFECSR